MKVSNLSISLFLFLNSVLTLAAASANFVSEADNYLSKLTDQDDFSGVVLVVTNGNVVLAKGYGLANREHNVVNTTNTVCRLGSVTKQFTAMCILILQEDHKLNVTNLISQCIDDCPEAWRTITIHHLLTHSSGIPSFTEFPDNLRLERLPATAAATVQRFRSKPLDFEPGSRMRYSNSGYVLLGYIIEQITGTTYDKFVAERIFQPLGMKHSSYDHPADVVPNRASGYSKRGKTIINCVPFAMDTPHAAGALRSTVGDLLIWDQSLYSTQLVSTSTLDLMFTPFKGDYCYGWFYGKSANHIRYEHAGGISGFTTDVIRFPKERVYVAVLSNLEGTNSRAIAEKLSRMLLFAEP